MKDTGQIITWLRDQAIRATEDVLKRGMNQAADALEALSQRNAQLEEAVKNSNTVQQIDEIRDEAYDLGVESALHHHFGLTWDDAAELRKQIAEIQEQHRWIPVTEGMPEERNSVVRGLGTVSKPVLVTWLDPTSEKAYPDNCFVREGITRNGEFTISHINGDLVPVAWMPQLKPYEPPKEVQK